ncbi:alpha-amylase family protein [Chitiniphilus purpureus]|uniref:Alpha-amylase family protein n=1 Tax=Chitiniphilus purpureus TaxID=2981137 RepID=A0ABY6DPJ8_9NEIS|nr:alpha-amylase family protein [Chitiniphilus sp. CD1]UXY16290.1 alpha-amylase family protein [Chitiniphilus sp. CD1]
MEANDIWYDNAVAYQLDVATFHDANGDGVGDLRGLTARLDYLRQLGINCLWLMPFHPTGDRDDGYDVTDYYGIDPRLGSFGDFTEMLDEARARGMRVLMDLVVNHTSDQHPWFQAARRSRDSPYRDYYVWATDPQDPQRDQVVFPDHADSVWTYDAVAQQHYFHRFYDFEPALNHGNPAVREEVRRIMGFWLSLGVSGFRVDAAPFLIWPKGPAQHFDDPHEVLRELRRHAARYGLGAALLGEANVAPAQLGGFFGRGDEMNQLFNFLGAERLFLALAREQAAPLHDLQARLPPLPPATQWLNFLRHHDELSLQWLDEDERQAVFQAFGPTPDMQAYGRGLRRRLAPMLDGDPDRIRLAFSLLFSRCGSPLLFYGDEIGMGENLALPGRYPVRTPMQWSDDANGGFSSAAPQALYRDVVRDGAFAFAKVNVVQQWQTPNSQLNWMQQLIAIRRACPELGQGGHAWLDSDDPAVLAETIHLGQGRIVCVHNLARMPRQFTLRHPALCGQPCYELFTRTIRHADTDGRLTLSLAPYGYHWFRVGGLFAPA